jgi:hypothetical protein
MQCLYAIVACSEMLKFEEFLVETEWMHAGGVSRSNTPMLHIFCVLQVAPCVFLASHILCMWKKSFRFLKFKRILHLIA